MNQRKNYLYYFFQIKQKLTVFFNFTFFASESFKAVAVLHYTNTLYQIKLKNIFALF